MCDEIEEENPIEFVFLNAARTSINTKVDFAATTRRGEDSIWIFS